MIKVKIKRIDKSLDIPKYQTEKSVAFDLYSREKISIEPRQLQIIPSNIIVEVPDQHFLAILPRSSTFQKKGLILANSMGVIDRDYNGPDDEIGILVFNITDQAVVVEKGERIAQGIFIRSENAEFFEADQISDKSRGGFGSTG